MVVFTDVLNPPQGYRYAVVNDIESIKDEDVIIVQAYNNDFAGIEFLKEIDKYNLKYLSLTQYGKPQARYCHINKLAFDTMYDEWHNNPKGHFDSSDFENIFQALEITKNLEGNYVEIGTFQGASARAALNYMKRAGIKRDSYFFDTYEGFTYEESFNSRDTLWKNTHTDTCIDEVRSYLSDYPDARLVKANIITDILPDSISKIAVCNIDVDMYDAVKGALYKVKDLMVKNGIIIAEDYGHTPALLGAQKAVNDFLEENPLDFLPIYINSGQMFLIKMV